MSRAASSRRRANTITRTPSGSLVEARDLDVVVVCRSGNRSALAAHTMQLLGYRKVSSMKTGLRGWNDYELPLVNAAGKTVPIEDRR